MLTPEEAFALGAELAAAGFTVEVKAGEARTPSEVLEGEHVSIVAGTVTAYVVAEPEADLWPELERFGEVVFSTLEELELTGRVGLHPVGGSLGYAFELRAPRRQG